MDILNKFSVNQMILVLATAIGAFGGFPTPPKMFTDLVKNEIVQWGLVFVLCYQGGAGQNVELAALATVVLYVAKKVLDNMN